MKLVVSLIAAAALLACGLSTGAQVYYFFSFALLILMALSLLSVLWALWTARIDLKGIQPQVERGGALTVILTLRHASLLPVAAVRVTLSVPSSFSPDQEISFSALPFSRKVFRHRIVCPHRGVFQAGITRISSSDLFGLFTLSRKSSARLRWVEVLPRVPQDLPLEPGSGDLGPENVRRSDEDTASPSDVRQWQEGDPLKKVHWKLSMRRQEVMVRVYEETARPDTLILPDLTEVSGLRDQALEWEDCVCEACAGAAKAQLEAGYPVRMPLTGKNPSEIAGQFPADLPRFVDALMRVKFDSPYDYAQVLTQMLRRASRTGGMVIVTPHLTSRVADFAVRAQLSGIRTRVIWISDTRMDQSLEMAERLRMDNVRVDVKDPWASIPEDGSRQSEDWHEPKG